jgi:bifunctional non-homologous end joining protein LigD
MPLAIEPQLATLVDRPPEGGAWLYEIKYDGYRALAWKRGRTVTLVSRRGLRLPRFGRIAQELAELPCTDAVLDGEVCAVRRSGATSFEALQEAISTGHVDDLVYFVFDVLFLDGEDLRPEPLEERKARLARLLPRTGEGIVRRAEHVRGHGAAFLEAARTLGLEGLVAKRADKAWRSGRSLDWQKVKLAARQEMVIVGYTAPRGTRSGFGALLVGVKNEGGAPTTFRYAGKVGTGFDDATLRSLHRRLLALAVHAPTVVDPPRIRDVHWVRPELVAEVRFTEWTRDGRLRHPVFVGLRDDKRAADVRRERPASSAVRPA